MPTFDASVSISKGHEKSGRARTDAVDNAPSSSSKARVAAGVH